MKKMQEAFIRTIDNGQLSHAYLFEGAKGIGKSEMAKEIAKILNCTNRSVGEGACQVCEHCLRIEHGNFPDYIVVEPEGTTIKVDQIRALKSQLTKTAMESSAIICVIHAVDTLTPGAANSLLKFLEEPTGNIHFILLTEQLSKVLITIQSRCQIIRFQSNQEDTVNGLLKEKGASNATAQLVSQLTNSADQAVLLLESESFGQIRQESWNWFVRIFTNRAMAFITIQSQVLPLLVSKVESEQFLTLLQLYIRKNHCWKTECEAMDSRTRKNDEGSLQNTIQCRSSGCIRTMGFTNPKMKKEEVRECRIDSYMIESRN